MQTREVPRHSNSQNARHACGSKNRCSNYYFPGQNGLKFFWVEFVVVFRNALEFMKCASCLRISAVPGQNVKVKTKNALIKLLNSRVTAADYFPGQNIAGQIIIFLVKMRSKFAFVAQKCTRIHEMRVMPADYFPGQKISGQIIYFLKRNLLTYQVKKSLVKLSLFNKKTYLSGQKTLDMDTKSASYLQGSTHVSIYPCQDVQVKMCGTKARRTCEVVSMSRRGIWLRMVQRQPCGRFDPRSGFRRRVHP